jgi:ABC-type branched-subunit amino acid transport system substrate-binding protein
MTSRSISARTRQASGRFVFLALVLGAPTLVGCASAGVETAAPVEEQSYPDPVIDPAPLGSGQEERATLLFGRARDAMQWGRTAEARVLAMEIVESYPSSSVSGRALWLVAQAALAGGEYELADQAAGRWADLLRSGDPRIGEARLLQSEAMLGAEDQVGRLQRLLAIGGDARSDVSAAAMAAARQSSSELTSSELQSVLDEARPDGLVRPVAMVRLAGLMASAGRSLEARRIAAEALVAGATGVDAVLAQDIIGGADPGFREPRGDLRFATVLPEGGSPTFRDFAKLIAEGVEVAAATWLGDQALVSVEARDDEGDPGRAAELVRELDEEDVLGAVGFLEEGALEAAGAERRGSLPLVSPTARTAIGQGLYTLAGADLQAAVEVARYAARSGFTRVAVLHSQAPESAEEAEAFQSAAQELGIPIDGVYSYPAGATFFGNEIRAARDGLRAEEIRALRLGPEDTLHVEDLEKVALFLPIPAEDVELLAPQVTFYGLDTLAIEVLGTSGWTDPQTLETVDNRHTTGVVATAPVGGEADSPGFQRFREAYEGHFQRSLTSRVPALGYDAAILLLEAARAGGGSRNRLIDALERIEGLEGATGVYSVRGGRVLRQTRLVLIEHGALLPSG